MIDSLLQPIIAILGIDLIPLLLIIIIIILIIKGD